MCINFGTLKIINFSFGTNEKLIILGVPVLKDIMVIVMKMEQVGFIMQSGEIG